MIDSRAGLRQDLAGDSLGLPCARIRPTKKKSNGLPTIELKASKEEGFHLAGGNADTDPSLIAFSGTKPLDLKSARARSQGCLRSGGPLDRVLKLRKEHDLERLVDVLVRAAPDQRHDALRYFKQPYNAHRAKMASRYIDEDHRRKLVLQILRKYPLCDIYDLVRVDEKLWASISRELGGLSYGVAIRSAMEVVAESMTSLERATFWAAVGTRQRAADHGRTVVFAAQDSPQMLH
ncbi:unnamed protein product [Durusdinium trenchii]|uniref:Uncharacterized protein n=2 Tax=Durusdinium trenchii TaxID=1381693 RepID=A0ABP0J7Z5_9DINO